MTGRKSLMFWKPLIIGALLAFLLAACGTEPTRPTASTSPDLTTWTQTESPLFPATWPPTSETVWVRYAFAYGRNPTLLIDGSYVTAPLSKTERRAGGASTTVLTREMTQAAVQGALPLDDATLSIFEKAEQVSDYCLKLTAMPDLKQNETQDLLAYYNAWFRYNGAFLDLIRDAHADFIDWVALNK
ncbi:MAG: hypothetical protein PHQ36_02870 [Anaerolineales bacterium]|nr:hypothetical protein [Anaerolineales bacterium]